MTIRMTIIKLAQRSITAAKTRLSPGMLVGHERGVSFATESIIAFDNRDTVATYHHHTNVVLLASFLMLNGLVNDKIHERIKAAHNTRDHSVAIDLDCHLMVH